MTAPTAPGGRTAGPTAVLTNGPWHGAWCWGAEDRILTPAVQRRLIAELDSVSPAAPTRVVELASSHSPFFSRPRELAAIIADAAFAAA